MDTESSIPNVHLFYFNTPLREVCSFSVGTLRLQLANIFQGRIEYELIYSLRGAKHRVEYSVHIR